MRTSNKVISIEELTSVDKSIAFEELERIAEFKNLEMIQVDVSYKLASGEEVARTSYTISGDDYALLMSASPSFAPEKPENEYREVDIWYVIDQINLV